MAKKYYGFRFYSNRSCTYGSPNPVTGRYSIAGNIEVFRSKIDLNNWLSGEKLSAPCGCGGGERKQVTKKVARSLSLGVSVEDFEMDLENQESERYDRSQEEWETESGRYSYV